MKKTLYSLMLSEDVIRAVDEMAHRAGQSRSGFINRVLAEYVSVPTPESRINEIFSALESFISPSRELVPFYAPNSAVMSLKSCLTYKYRPTVKYEVELAPEADDALGVMSVIYRTQSPALIASITEFFNLWVGIENEHLAPLLGEKLDYALYDGKFVRSIATPRVNCTSEEIAAALSEYIGEFDRMLKGYIGGSLCGLDVERSYCKALGGRRVLI